MCKDLYICIRPTWVIQVDLSISRSADEQHNSICNLNFPLASNRTKWWFPGIRTCTSLWAGGWWCHYSADYIHHLCCFSELVSQHCLLTSSTSPTWASLLSRKRSDVPSKFPPRAFVPTVPLAKSACLRCQSGSCWLFTQGLP